MTDPQDTDRTGPDADGMPSDEQLREPSVEKEPGEEPKAPTPHDPEPRHEATGIGVLPTEPVQPPDSGDPGKAEEPHERE